MRHLAIDYGTRRIGLALLTLGLLNLGWGLWSQSRFLAVVRRRHPLPPGAPRGYQIRSTFVVAGLLLALGGAAFATMIVQTFS